MSNQIQSSEQKDPVQLAYEQWNANKTDENARLLKEALPTLKTNEEKRNYLNHLTKKFSIPSRTVKALLQTEVFESKYAAKKRILKLQTAGS